MREFGPTIGAEKRAEIVRAAEELFEAAGDRRRRESRASEFELEIEDDPVVTREADVHWPDGRLRIAKTTPEARPAFEWLIEITSNVGETDYFKHYLVLDQDVVLAQRKVLTPIDDAEADMILADLAAASADL
jgi:hypothetical protein